MTVLLLPAEGLPVSALKRVAEVADAHPGSHRLTVVIGDRRLTLGPPVRASQELLEALREFGQVEVIDAGRRA